MRARYGVTVAAVIAAAVANTVLLVAGHASAWAIAFGLATPLVGLAEWLRARALGDEAQRVAHRMLGVVILALLAMTEASRLSS